MDALLLNKQQQEAVEHIDKPLLVIAGAGSGKTRIITHKIIHLIREYGVDLDSILAITFTNKAANEMSRRVMEALDIETPPKWITTFHSMSAKILRYEAHHVGYEKDFVIYDEVESLRMVKNVLYAMKLSPDVYDAKIIREAISEIKQKLNAKLIDYYNQEIPMFRDIFTKYITAMRAANAMDFDDLLMYTVKLFRTTPEVRDDWQKKFDFYLVDEYQDTNKAQHDILMYLVGDSKYVTVVGDPQQCLHGDSIIETDSGLKKISELQINDMVLTASRGRLFFSPITNIIRHRDRDVVRITTRFHNKSIKATIDHRFFATEPLFDGNNHYVYLMYKKKMGFRVGVTIGGGLQSMLARARSERADRMWILKRFDSASEACCYENIVSLEYGIPKNPFYNFKRTLRLTQDHLNHIFELFGNNGLDLIKNKKLSFDYPNYVPQGVSNKHISNVNVVMNMSKGTYISYECGNAKNGGYRIRKFFKSYKEAYEYASNLAIEKKVDIIRERLYCNGEYLAEVPASQLTETMKIPVVFNNEIVLDEISSICSDGKADVYDIEISETGIIVADGILSHNCIYEWRGAHPENILKFEHDFPDALTVKLEQNYRSTKKILTAANAVIHKASGEWKKKLLHLWTENQDGNEIILREFYDRGKEAAYVASEISKLRTLKKLNYNDFAILVRMTFLTRYIEEALMSLRIPYQIIGGLRFGQRKEIRDMVSYLSLVHNPKDEQAFERVINVPSRGIGEVAIEKIKNADGETYVEKVRNALPSLSKKQREAAEKFVVALEFVANRANEFPHDALAYIYNAIGYETYLKDKFKNESFDRISNVRELMALLKTIQLNGRTLSNFLEESKLVSDQDDLNEKDTVKVMTIHAAKGLEFEIVFMVGLEEGILPCSMAITPEQLEEERRLFYVASTRPKSQLRLSYAVNEYGKDYSMKRMEPSRYLRDIKDYVKFI